MEMKFYRYETVQYASMDVDGEYCSSPYPNPKLELSIYNMLAETPKGYWIGYGKIDGLHNRFKWVSKTARKRFAYPTKEEALHNFIKRTEKRLSILEYQAISCKVGLSLANKVKQSTANVN